MKSQVLLIFVLMCSLSFVDVDLAPVEEIKVHKIADKQLKQSVSDSISKPDARQSFELSSIITVPCKDGYISINGQCVKTFG